MLTVHMEKRGDYYNSFGQDAADIAKALGDVVVTKEGSVGIPAHALEPTLVRLNEMCISVKINCRIKV